MEQGEPTGKVFTEGRLFLGSYLGGPLIAGYIIYNNYKVFNEPEMAKKVIYATIFITIIIFTGIFLIPEDVDIPNSLIPLLYTCIAYSFLKQFQGKRIEEHIKNGGQLMSWKKTLLIGILGSIITFASLVPVYMAFL